MQNINVIVYQKIHLTALVTLSYTFFVLVSICSGQTSGGHLSCFAYWQDVARKH